MERDDPRNGMRDEQFLALFKDAGAPAPSREFAARTMRAVRRAPLPAGRRALRDPLAAMFGWAAVIAAVALSVFGILASQPIVAAGFSRLITRGVGTGVWLMQFGQTALRLLDVLITTGSAVSRAAVTAEGTAGLVLSVVVAALSLSALHRLLISKREDPRWQELS
jgi:hypothetical protein